MAHSHRTYQPRDTDYSVLHAVIRAVVRAILAHLRLPPGPNSPGPAPPAPEHTAATA